MTRDEVQFGGPMCRSLVIGKFWPPHIGHHQMIDDVARGVDTEPHTQFVIVCAAEGQRPSGRERARWMQAIHPATEVIVVDDICAHHFPDPCTTSCTPLWVEKILGLGIGVIDIVATNEDYGPGFASGIGAVHVFTDRGRFKHPVSATRIRSDLPAMWPHLHPIVRAGLYRRVVVLGAESTGTSTLSRDLSLALDAPLAGESGRTVSWEKYAITENMEAVTWADDDFWAIVNQQIRLEHDAIWSHLQISGTWRHDIGPVLICDTDTLATVAWWERYLLSDVAAVTYLANQRLADAYIVTSPVGIEFDDSDPTRDGRRVRSQMHDRFLQLVSRSGRPWIEVKGSPGERLDLALSFLTWLEQSHPRFIHCQQNN